MEYEDHFHRLSSARPVLAGELSGVTGLGGVLAWMGRRGLPLGSAEIVAQDEFSLDFIVPLPGGEHLVLGIT